MDQISEEKEMQQWPTSWFLDSTAPDQYQGIVNTIVQLFIFENSVVIHTSKRNVVSHLLTANP